jgi:hypothetical protein
MTSIAEPKSVSEDIILAYERRTGFYGSASTLNGLVKFVSNMLFLCPVIASFLKYLIFFFFWSDA